MNEPHPLAGLRPAPAPHELRGRVLAAAAQSRAAVDARAGWLVRACDSRALRIAWSVILLVALFGHLAVSWELGRTGPPRELLDDRWRLASPAAVSALTEAR